jgi:hypothetical protein
MSSASATSLQSAIDAIVSARPRGRDAILAITTSHPMVVAVEARTRSDGDAVSLVNLDLRAAEAPTFADWTRAAGLPEGGPMLVSPSNVPPEHWAKLPVGWKFPQPWGVLYVAHGDAEQRLVSANLHFAR